MIEAWRRTLAELGPEAIPGTTSWRVPIADEAVMVHVARTGADTVAITASAPLSRSIARLSIMRPEDALTDAGRFVTGDAELDAHAWIFAAAPSALAALGASTRRLLLELVKRGASFRDGEVRLEPWAAAALPAGLIVDTLRKMVQLSAIMTVPDGREAWQRIAKIAAGDSDPEVRDSYQTLALSTPEGRQEAERLASTQATVADDATFVRLVNLTCTAMSGSAVREAWMKLLALFPFARVATLFGAVDKGVAEMLMGRLVALAGQRPGDLDAIARGLVTLSAKRGRPEASAAIGVAQVLGRARCEAGIPWLAQTLERLDSKEAVRAALAALLVMPASAAQLLGALGKDGTRVALAEAPDVAAHVVARGAALGPLFRGLYDLIALLDRDQRIAYLRAMAEIGDPSFAPLARDGLGSEDLALQIAAIDTLGAIGDTSDVARLAPLGRGFFRSGDVKLAVVRASQAIRDRGPDVGEGALALADGGGELALSDDDEDR